MQIREANSQCKPGVGAGLISWKRGQRSNSFSAFFEEMPWQPDAWPGRKALDAKNWISLPTKQVRVRLEETSRKFRECRKGAMQVCEAGQLVVAAVWVYRGSVVSVLLRQ
jgi:hypothetical protein